MAAADEPPGRSCTRSSTAGPASSAAAVSRASRLDLATEAVPGVLGRLGGERRLTDLGHVGQLLHTVAVEQQLGVSSLTSWLRQRIADADRDSADEDRALRLDSDAEAVVLTVHRSKGLEFPIVYHPFAWQAGYIDQDEPPAYHDDQNDDVWTIDVGGMDLDIARHRRLRDREQRGEDLRLLYVALTRTMHQATVWWAAAWQCYNSSLGRLLRAGRRRRRRCGGTHTPDDDEFVSRLEALAAQAPGRIAVERIEASASARWAGEPRRAVELDASTFERTLDARWRRVSYSGIVSGAREQPVATEPSSTSSTTSCLPPLRRRTPRRRAMATRSACARHRPLAAMPGGADGRPPPPCLGGDRLRAPTSTPNSPRAWPSSDTAATSTSVTQTPRSRALRRDRDAAWAFVG